MKPTTRTAPDTLEALDRAKIFSTEDVPLERFSTNRKGIDLGTVFSRRLRDRKDREGYQHRMLNA
jgi:hypothetical protein